MTDQLANIGQRIRALRETANITQHGLATKVGISRTSITNIEAGRQDTTITVILAIADALNVPAGTLFGEQTEPSVSLSLLTRLAGQQRRIAGTLAESGDLLRRLAQDSDEMRADMDALSTPAADLPLILAAVDNALRNGSYMTGANLAFEMLCDRLGVDRDRLVFRPGWAATVPDADRG